MCLRYIAYWGGQNHIVFMGDSRIRQLYWALVHQVQQPGGAAAEGQQAHRDLRFEEKDLRLTVVSASASFGLVGGVQGRGAV